MVQYIRTTFATVVTTYIVLKRLFCTLYVLTVHDTESITFIESYIKMDDTTHKLCSAGRFKVSYHDCLKLATGHTLIGGAAHHSPSRALLEDASLEDGREHVHTLPLELSAPNTPQSALTHR